MINVDEQLIAKMVKDIIAGLPAEAVSGAKAPSQAGQKVTAADYPLSVKRPDLVRTSTGKTLDEITLDGVMEGTIGPMDIRISQETLEMQAQVAESVGRPALARNFRRARELIRVPDKRILEMYNALRPFRSTKPELLAMADELEKQFEAVTCAAMVREAADVYERRGRLKAD